jgi:Ca2+/Na+ antiporter
MREVENTNLKNIEMKTVARIILFLCVVGSLGIIEGIDGKITGWGIIIIIVLAVVFLLFLKKADIFKSIKNEDPSIID